MAKRKQKVDFAGALREMLVRIGAQPSPNFYELVLETKAGPLYLSPHEDWLATRFDNPSEAARIIPGGSLNRYSGKWNWHYIKPTIEDVENLERVMLKVRLSPEPGMLEAA